MVDPNPLRGMPAQLKAYWLAGKGAARIRWGMPGDFMRCVRALRTKFPQDPKGLCSNLHQDALGKRPGQHAHLTLEDFQADALLAAAPLGEIRWLAPLAPIGKPTGDGRQFASGALTFRRFPLPLSWVKAETGGHSGRMTVGRILGATIGPDEFGQEYAWGFGDFFNPAVIPEVVQALELVRGGVAGISLDPGGFVQVGLSADDPQRRVFTSYKAGGATLVSIPAFEDQYVLLSGPDDVYADDDDTDEQVMMADWDAPDHDGQDGEGLPLAGEDCGCDEGELAVNGQGWRGLPLAPRKTPVDKDHAARRIAVWANGDVRKLNQAFLWRHPQGDPHSVYSYRLPVGDIIDGKLTLIYHAIYAASALLEGAHGGLPNIPASEKEQLRRVISGIYRYMAAQFGDPTMKASWDRAQKRDNGVTPVEKKAGDSGDFAEVDMPLTEIAAQELVDGEDAEKTGEDVQGVPVAVGARLVRFTLDLESDGEKSVLDFEVFDTTTGALMGHTSQVVNTAEFLTFTEPVTASTVSLPTDEPDTLLAGGGPLVPPAAWFERQDIAKDPGITVTPEGQVFGYLAPWKQCHMSVGRGSCVRAPKSRTSYKYFHLGSTRVDSGDVIKVGRLTVGAGHANESMGVLPAMEHYDNSATTVAVVRAHEDAFGIQVAGAIVPGATPDQVATLRRSPLSGDWRRAEGGLELVAALAVNVPGFPVFTADTEGHELAMISVGFDLGAELGDHVHVGADVPIEPQELAVNTDEVAEKVIEILDEREAHKSRVAALMEARKFSAEEAQNRRAEILRNIVGVK